MMRIILNFEKRIMMSMSYKKYQFVSLFGKTYLFTALPAITSIVEEKSESQFSYR
jgi:hypothetical protein